MNNVRRNVGLVVPVIFIVRHRDGWRAWLFRDYRPGRHPERVTAFLLALSYPLPASGFQLRAQSW